jgi:hypothetical protein
MIYATERICALMRRNVMQIQIVSKEKDTYANREELLLLLLLLLPMKNDRPGKWAEIPAFYNSFTIATTTTILILDSEEPTSPSQEIMSSDEL